MNSNEKKEQPASGPKMPRFRMPWIYLVVVIGLLIFWLTTQRSVPETTWSEFEQEMLATGDVEKLNVLNGQRMEVYIYQDSLLKAAYKEKVGKKSKDKAVPGPHFVFSIGSIEVFAGDLEKAEKKHGITKKTVVTYENAESWWSSILMWLLPIGLIILFWVFMFRRIGGMGGGGGAGSPFSFGKTRARVYEKGKTTVTFADVAGIEEAKEELYELVKFLKDPNRYQRLGAKMPKGVLLAGPPGTGKTLLAKAVAGEAGVPFFSLSGSEFVEMFVGVGAARMRDLFDKAKAKAPSIIFIDEIDTVGRARGKVSAFQANDERESTLNQLLAELDGFDASTGVIILAATNRPDLLDPALLRPGRFDRHIHLDLPNLIERKAIFEVHLRPLKLADDVDPEMLAAHVPGFSGADIANICNEAALIAARNDKEAVGRDDFMNAVDRVIGGLEKKTKIISGKEKNRIAYHEAGHVTVSWFLEHAPPVLKVSIIPRGRSLGAAWFLPEEKQIILRSQFLDSICAALGGRAAETLVFEEISSNALDDLEKVTKLAYSMVTTYGLSEEIRNISYYDSSGRSDMGISKPYSEATAQKIDAEVQRIVDGAFEKTIEILVSNREKLDRLADALVEREVVYRDDIKEILGERPEAS